MKKSVKTSLLVIGSVIVTTALVLTIRKIVKNAKAAKADKTKKPTTTGGTNGQQVDTAENYNPDPLAREIKKNIEGYNLKTYPETAQKILLLTDAELKKLYTHYNKNYAKEYPTLTQLFDNEWTDWNGYYGKVAARLKSLKMY